MKITNLFVSGFLGVHSAEVRTDEAIQLFAGANGAGKSSMRDAVALALTADLSRVSLKKEAGQLVHTGAEHAACEVQTADGEVYGVTISAAGKISDTRKGKESDPVLSYVLDAQRLARLDPTDRRAFLFGLMGVKTSPASIKEMLAARQLDAAKVERILPLLRSGFDAASKDAKSKATEAKGSWRALTGETFGSEKAKTWRAAVPAIDAGAAAEVATELQHCDVAIESWQQQIGGLQRDEQHREALRAKLPELDQLAGRLDRIEAKLLTDTAGLEEWEQRLAATAAEAGSGKRVGLVHDLAAAVDYLLAFVDIANISPEDADAKAALAAYEAEHGKLGVSGDPEALARLPQVRQSRDLMASAVANGRRDLAAAQAASTEAQAIQQELAQPFSGAALAEARQQIEALKTKRTQLVGKSDALRAAKVQADAADKKTTQASQFAEDVAAWDAIGDALAPDGIPAQILASALSPFNARLAQSAADAEWPVAVIGADMGITVGGREYRLLSESEQWRADAMLAEAVAHLSGARLLVLDRFDVLDMKGRTDLIAWLDILAQDGEIDTALVFGTLKALPAGLPATVGAHWIERGVLAQLKEAA